VGLLVILERKDLEDPLVLQDNGAQMDSQDQLDLLVSKDQLVRGDQREPQDLPEPKGPQDLLVTVETLETQDPLVHQGPVGPQVIRVSKEPRGPEVIMELKDQLVKRELVDSLGLTVNQGHWVQLALKDNKDLPDQEGIQDQLVIKAPRDQLGL